VSKNSGSREQALDVEHAGIIVSLLTVGQPEGWGVQTSDPHVGTLFARLLSGPMFVPGYC